MSELHIKELERARERIEMQQSIFICDALRNMPMHPSTIWSTEAREIKNSIDGAIEGKFCLKY